MQCEIVAGTDPQLESSQHHHHLNHHRPAQQGIPYDRIGGKRRLFQRFLVGSGAVSQGTATPLRTRSTPRAITSIHALRIGPDPVLATASPQSPWRNTVGRCCLPSRGRTGYQ